jgi:hypothetical protein
MNYCILHKKENVSRSGECPDCALDKSKKKSSDNAKLDDISRVEIRRTCPIHKQQNISGLGICVDCLIHKKLNPDYSNSIATRKRYCSTHNKYYSGNMCSECLHLRHIAWYTTYGPVGRLNPMSPNFFGKH